MRRSREKERPPALSGGAAAAAKAAEARGFKPGNRDLLELLGKGDAAPESAAVEQAAAEVAASPATSDPGAGGAVRAEAQLCGHAHRRSPVRDDR